MRDDRASGTALRVAIRRAAHQIFDTPPLVLTDPIAVPILGPTEAERLRRSGAIERNRLARAVRAFMVARSRFAEDALEAARARGARQYVILGAGLDTFAYRTPLAERGLTVFEVDHPATQAWKRERLRVAGIAAPPEARFVPHDFVGDDLGGSLERAGFRADVPTFFSWLGVTMYLTEPQIAAVLRYVASTPRGGGIALDYAVPRDRLPAAQRFLRDLLERRVARAGEPFRSAADPGEVRTWVTRSGLRPLEDLGRVELNERYFRDRPDGLAVRGDLGRVHAAAR